MSEMISIDFPILEIFLVLIFNAFYSVFYQLQRKNIMAKTNLSQIARNYTFLNSNEKHFCVSNGQSIKININFHFGCYDVLVLASDYV